MLVFDYAVYDDGGFSQTKKYGACLKPNGRPRIVVSSFDDGFDYSDASGFRAARRFVAYQDTYTDHYGAGSLSLNVYDVRGGRSTFSTTVETWDPTFGPYEVLGDYALEYLPRAIRKVKALASRPEAWQAH